jgi:hypothetical protein
VGTWILDILGDGLLLNKPGLAAVHFHQLIKPPAEPSLIS